MSRLQTKRCGRQAATPQLRFPPRVTNSRVLLDSERSISVPFERTRPPSKCSGCREKYQDSHMAARNSPERRSHEVRRMSARRDHFRAILARRPVLSPTRITLENKGKTRPQANRENIRTNRRYSIRNQSNIMPCQSASKPFEKARKGAGSSGANLTFGAYA